MIDGRFHLHGSIDLVEEHAATGELRVTDHKTGKYRGKDHMMVDGGRALQPVLYSLALEEATGRPVVEGRLYYATTAGGYRDVRIPLTPQARRIGIEVLEIIDRAIETGFLAPAPDERACTWCDFRPVCGPTAEHRISRVKSARSAGRPDRAAEEAMSAIPLADAADRELIRHRLDDTVIVEAAAGTGKTTELVQRILNVLASGRARIEQIVAVTFTEKAAGELKLRIRKELESLRQRSADAPVIASITDAIQRLEEAHVSTIHGFCADLLRERPVEAGIDPLFEVLTEPRAARIFNDAFRAWLHDRLEHPPEGVRRALRRSVWSRDGRDNDDGPVDRISRAGRELAEWRDFDGVWRRDPFDRDAELHRVLARLHDVAGAHGRAGIAARPALSRHRADSRVEPRRRRLLRGSMPTIPTAGKRASSISPRTRTSGARAAAAAATMDPPWRATPCGPPTRR